MREFVFPDPSLTSRAGQFVWLAINTEEEKNAPFLLKFPGEAVPTFAVLDPRDESVVLRLVGSMSVPQLHAFLDNARIAVAGSGGSGRQADETLRAADQDYGRRRYTEAAEAYRLALGQAPAEWPPYARAVEALLYSYQETSAHDRCVELVQGVLNRLAGTPSELTVATTGRRTVTPSRSAWNCSSPSFTAAPPSTLSWCRRSPASRCMASRTSRVW